jgi:hypothetical protein
LGSCLTNKYSEGNGRFRFLYISLQSNTSL